jgi:hypothetical protein
MSADGLPISLGLLLAYLLTSLGPFIPYVLPVMHAAIGAILCLYLVGHSLRVAFLKGNTFAAVSLRGRVAFDVALSVLSLMISSVGLSVAFLLNGGNLMLILGSIIVGSNALQLARPRVVLRPRPLSALPDVPVVIIILVGLIVALIFREGFAWPSMPGWDVYVHLAASNWIFRHDGVANLFPAGSQSSAPYPYIFYVLVAALSGVFGTTPYTIFWFGSYYAIPIYGILVYAIASILTHSKIQSLVASLLAVTVSGGETLLGPQYFFPSTAFILLFLLCIVAIVESPLRGIPQVAFALAALSACYMVYYYPLFLTLPAIALVLMLRSSNPSHVRRATAALIVALAASVLLTYYGSTLLRGTSLSFAEDVAVLRGSYPDLLLLFIGFGGLFVAYRFIIDHPKQLVQLGLVAYVFTLLAMYFLPVPDSYRSELLFRPFMAVVASYTVIAGLGAFFPSYPVQARSSQVIRPSRRAAKTLTVILLVVSAAFLIQPYVVYGQQVPGFSNVSSDEYQASLWLARNTPANGYILTDPSTGSLLRGLTLINSSTALIIRGHTPSPQDNYTLTSIVYDFFTTQNLTEVPTYLSMLPEAPNFVVVTTRTASWASWGGINSTFPAPTDDAPNSFAGFQKFNTPMFSLVASWNTVKIYALTGMQLEPISNGPISANDLGEWYLDGEYGNYSADFSKGTMQIAVQPSGASNAWTGPSILLPNTTDLGLLKISYQVEDPMYSLELLLWRANGSSTIYTLSQSPGTDVATIPLSDTGSNNLTRVTILLWTQDTQVHTVDVDSLLLYGYVDG